MDVKEFKETLKMWLCCVAVFFLCGGILSVLRNPNTYDIKELREQKSVQEIKVFGALKENKLIPQEELDQIEALRPEWEEKKEKKVNAWSAIGPGGKIKDAGSTTSKGHRYHDALDAFKEVDKKMNGYKTGIALRYGEQLIGTPDERKWEWLQSQKKRLQALNQNKRFYEKGWLQVVFSLFQAILTLAAFASGFGAVCLFIVLILGFMD